MGCWIILCGCRTRRRRQKKPSKELKAVLDTNPICYCSNCNAIRDPVIYRYNSWFTLYFIPLFRVSKGPEVLCCPVCTSQLQTGTQQNVCTGCGRWNAQRGGFCPSCATPIGTRVGR